MKRRKGFTLVELLVVIGIIALLIGILLPALNRARAQAQLVQCESNIRQIITAELLFAQDHHNNIPTCSDDQYAIASDTTPTSKFAYRTAPPNPTSPMPYVVLDWASSLIPYLGQGSGAVGNNTFLTTAGAQNQSKVFQCPSDVWLSDATPGYAILNNVNNSAPHPLGESFFNYQPISYGLNADITIVTDSSGVGRFTPGSPTIDVYAGPTIGPGKPGQPLNCRIDRVYKSVETLLIADCGTRPLVTATSFGMDENTALYFSTNNAKSIPQTIPPSPLKGPGGRLINIVNGSGSNNAWGSNIPIAKNAHNPSKVDRHIGGVINIGFCDGHVETLGLGDFVKVRVSPYRY